MSALHDSGASSKLSVAKSTPFGSSEITFQWKRTDLIRIKAEKLTEKIERKFREKTNASSAILPWQDGKEQRAKLTWSKHQNRCVLQKRTSASEETRASDSFLSGRRQQHDTVAVELRRTTHLATTLGPNRSYHAATGTGITYIDRLRRFVSQRDMSGWGQG